MVEESLDHSKSCAIHILSLRVTDYETATSSTRISPLNQSPPYPLKDGCNSKYTFLRLLKRSETLLSAVCMEIALSSALYFESPSTGRLALLLLTVGPCSSEH